MSIREFDGCHRMACDRTQECGYIYYQNPIPAAGAIVIENDKLLLVKRAHPPKVGFWCIPAGFMEWNEHPTETAIREILEETGLRVKLTSIFEIYTGDDDPRSNAVLILYLAKTVGGTMRAGDDASEVAYFGFNELPEPLAFVAHDKAVVDYVSQFRK